MSTTSIQIRKQNTDIPGCFAFKRNRILQADPNCTMPPVTEGRDGPVKRKRLNPINESIDVHMQEFKNVVNNKDTDSVQFLAVIREVRRLAIRIKPEETHFLQKLLTLGLLPCMTQTVITWGDSDDDQSGHILFEAIWVLIELSSRKGSFASSIRRSGAASVSNLIKLMGKNHSSLRENTMWLLSNLLADNDGFHQTVLREQQLLTLLKQNMAVASSEQDLSMVSTCAWTMSNLFCTSGDSTIPLWAVLEWVPMVVSNLIFVVQKRIKPELCVDLVAALNHLTRHSPEACDAVLQQQKGGIIVALIDVLNIYGIQSKHCYLQMVIPAMKSLEIFVSSTNEKHAAAVVTRNMMSRCIELLYSRKLLMQQTVFTFFLTVASSKHSQIQRSLIDRLIAMPLVAFATEGVTKVKEIALLTITTIITKSNFGSRVYAFGCLKPFCYYLGRECADEQVLVAILDSVYSLFTECAPRRTKAFIELRGGECLDALVYHANEHVARAAERILEKFFRVEEEESPPKMHSAADRATTADVAAVGSAVMTHPEENNLPLFHQRDDSDFSPPTSKRLFSEATTPKQSSSNAFGGSLWMNTGN